MIAFGYIIEGVIIGVVVSAVVQFIFAIRRDHADFAARVESWQSIERCLEDDNDVA